VRCDASRHGFRSATIVQLVDRIDAGLKLTDSSTLG
jgi:hypothetical protein